MGEHKVIVYSTPTCPWCKKAKEFLKEHDIKFEDVDVAADKERAQEMIEKSGQMGVPVIEIDDTVIIGFDKEEMEKLLEIKA
tara:strand:- start:639 stop:884 length:246 start_codon:yes stop_codon:yes gene_type:complete